MNMQRVEQVTEILRSAMDQFGTADREFLVRFGGSTPIVDIQDDGEWIATLWLENGIIKMHKP